MKNLKKVLSLVLAATMATSLMSTAAFAKDTYADADKVNFNEAVDVMSAIGVFQGNNGQFNPQGDLTRESAAKIITYMLMGKENADQLKAGSAPYSDVAADRWSAGAISYCTAQGIIAGSNGKFMPTEKVTGVQFAKMLLVALGYDAKIEKMVGPSWAIYTSTLAVSANLNEDMEGVLLSAPLTREQAAMMAFNTLKADTVKYANKGTEIKLADGTTVMMGATPAEKVVAGPEYITGSNQDANQQFVEKYYKDLKLDTTNPDDMGRPAKVWSLKNEEVGTYAATPDYTFVATEKDGNNQTVAALVKDTNKNLKFAGTAKFFVNGAEGTITAKSDDVDAGSKVELYLNDAGEVETVAVTKYDVKTVSAEVTTKVKDDTDYISVPGVTTGYVKADTVVGANGLVKDDVVLTYADKEGVITIKKAASVKGVVAGYHTTKGVSVNGTFYDNTPAGAGPSAWTDFKNTYTFYLNDANQVVANVQETAEAAANYAAVVDVAWVAGSGINGSNYMEAKIVKPDATTEIVKVESVDGFKVVSDSTDLKGATYYYGDASNSATSGTVNGVTAKTYYYTNPSTTVVEPAYYAVADTADLTAASTTELLASTSATKSDAKPALIVENALYSYEINSDGKYELKSTGAGDDTIIKLDAASSSQSTNDTYVDPKNPALGAATANDKTVFVYAVTDGDDTTYTAYTGIKNVPAIGAFGDGDYVTNETVPNIVKNEDGFATLAFFTVDSGDVAGAFDKDLVYITDNAFTTMKNGDKTYYVYDAIVNGEKTTINLTQNNKTVGMYVVASADADGYKTLGPVGSAAANMVGINRVGGGAFVTGDPDTGLVEQEYATKTYAYNDKTVAYFINEDGESTQMAVEALSKDATDLVWVVTDSADANLATEIYVVEKDQQAKTLVVAAGVAGDAANSGNLYHADGANVTGATLTSTTLTVTAGATPGMKYTVAIKGNGTGAVEKTGTSASWGAQAVNSAYTTVADDSVITVVVTAEDEFSGLSSVYTYTFTVTAD